MIVVAIIAIIAAIAIPGLLRARISANEGSAIGSLRTMATAQAQYQSQSQSDQDNDGTGEFGLLGELAGTAPRRSNPARIKANPSFVTAALGPVGTLNYSTKSGYRVQMILPGLITDSGTATGMTYTLPGVTVDAQETKWRMYAWPVAVKASGIRCFGVDQAAEVLAAANMSGTNYRYSGGSTMPSYTAAVPTTDADNNMFNGNMTAGTGTDTQRWAGAGN
jgi:hypothetical protein